MLSLIYAFRAAHLDNNAVDEMTLHNLILLHIRLCSLLCSRLKNDVIHISCLNRPVSMQRVD